MMKVYSVSHNGFYIGGYVVVFAENEADALQKATETLISEKIIDTPDKVGGEIIELNPDVKPVWIISTGDY